MRILTLLLLLLTLLIGCLSQKSTPTSQYAERGKEYPIVARYWKIRGQRFKADYPNLKEFSRSMHGEFIEFLMPDGKILEAVKHKDWIDVWDIIIRPPYKHEMKRVQELINED